MQKWPQIAHAACVTLRLEHVLKYVYHPGFSSERSWEGPYDHVQGFHVDLDQLEKEATT